MKYVVRESDTGDPLGTIEVADDAADEQILETLMQADYIASPAEWYSISDGDFATDEGERTVRDENDEPVLLLDPGGNGDEEDDDDGDEDDEPEEDDEDEYPGTDE